MKRLLLFGITCAALVACSSKQGTGLRLPPEEVLQRAAKATQTLDSAQYVLQSDFDASADPWSAAGVFRMDGMLQGAGDQLRFQLDITADVKTIDSNSSVDGTLEVVVISDDEVYMNLHSLTAQPSSTFFHPQMIGKIAGKWWLLPSGDNAPTPTAMTPDPRLLQMQSQVVRVTKDRGVENLQGRDSYHYDVVLDKEKLLTYLSAMATQSGEKFNTQEMQAKFQDVNASGQIWIDAETFYMQQISWVIQSLPLEGGGTASLSFIVTFRNHNNTPVIQPPENATLFTPEVFLSLPIDALFPEELPAQPNTKIQEDSLEELLRQINSTE